MENKHLFTIKEFAQLHHLNKRTLHYYDEIQLFSPKIKKANGYRYYTPEQSGELEYILALKQLGLSLQELKCYLANPDKTVLYQITADKLTELDEKINHLKRLKAYLIEKQANLAKISDIQTNQIIIKEAAAEYHYYTDMKFNDSALKNTDFIMNHLQHAWQYHPFKIGCGSFISTQKLYQGEFREYDGLYSVIEKQKLQGNMRICEQGTYLFAYHIGKWNQLTSLYQKILKKADDEGFVLSGYAYERGISELSLLDSEEYITEIKIKCEKKQ